MVRVAVIHPEAGDEIAARHAARLKAAGAEVLPAGYLDPLPDPVDALLVYGPFGSLAPLIRQLHGFHPGDRPALILIQGEQLPNPGIPDFLLNIFGDLRSALELRAYVQTSNGAWQPRQGWERLIRRGLRLRYFGDLRRLQRMGLPDGLLVWSRWTAAYLEARGFPCRALPPVHNPAWGAHLGLERDIPVLWLGKIGSRRRGRLLKRVRADLRARGIELMVIDGVEQPYVFGEARTRLLNRTRIVLNLLREKWDNNSLRFVLAAHNGALAVGEPVLPHTPFEPGEHMVVAPVEQLAETIVHYLENEPERARIARQALEMLRQTTAAGDRIVEVVLQAARRRELKP